MKPVTLIWLVALACLVVPGCSEPSATAEGEDLDLPEHVPVVEEIDTRSKPGRMFMFTDEHGKLVKTSSYADIPKDKRATVVVLEKGEPATPTAPSGQKNPPD